MNIIKPDLSRPTFRVGIVAFDDMDVLDFTGAFEVFSMAGRILTDSVYQDETEPNKAVQVVAIAQADKTIRLRGNLPIQPHYTFDNHPRLDLLIVPGGWGTRREANNPVMVEWLRRVTLMTPMNASVCTGAFLLGAVGLLNGRKATTHWASLDRLAIAFPEVTVLRDVRWVDNGDVVTSAGISAGIDMSLHLVERLFGLSIAQRTARQMDYDWQHDLTALESGKLQSA